MRKAKENQPVTLGQLSGLLDGQREFFKRELKDRIDHLEKGIDNRFGGVDGKFKGINERFDILEKRFDGLDQYVKDLEQQLVVVITHDLDPRVSVLEKRVSRLEHKLA